MENYSATVQPQQSGSGCFFQKISGRPAASGPFQPGPGKRGQPAESRLPAILTPRLASGLSESAAAFLARQHIVGEPGRGQGREAARRHAFPRRVPVDNGGESRHSITN